MAYITISDSGFERGSINWEVDDLQSPFDNEHYIQIGIALYPGGEEFILDEDTNQIVIGTILGSLKPDDLEEGYAIRDTTSVNGDMADEIEVEVPLDPGTYTIIGFAEAANGYYYLIRTASGEDSTIIDLGATVTLNFDLQDWTTEQPLHTPYEKTEYLNYGKDSIEVFIPNVLPKKDGAIFSGWKDPWSDSDDRYMPGSTALFKPGSYLLIPDSSVIKDFKCYIYDSSSSEWKKAVPYIYYNGEWKKAIPYTYYNGDWR